MCWRPLNSNSMNSTEEIFNKYRDEFMGRVPQTTPNLVYKLAEELGWLVSQQPPAQEIWDSCFNDLARLYAQDKLVKNPQKMKTIMKGILMKKNPHLLPRDYDKVIEDNFYDTAG